MSDFEKKLAEEIGKQIPIKDAYDDLAKQSIKSTGEIAGLIPRAINGALAPLHKWILHKEYSIEQTKLLLEEKLKNIDPEQIVEPESFVAVPALQAISYCNDNEELRNLYANLLASSMTKEVKKYVHPAFVEIIKQLSPDEAKILKVLNKEDLHPIVWLKSTNKKGLQSETHIKNFTIIGEQAKCEIISNVPSYIDNLERLKIINVFSDKAFSNKVHYDKLKNHTTIINAQKSKIPEDRIYKIEEGVFEITTLGQQFCKICVE